MRVPKFIVAGMLIATSVASVLLPVMTYAAPAQSTGDDSGFSLQVSPSPLVATVKPGTTTALDLQIRNTSSQSQDLKMGLRSFTVDDATGQVKLTKQEPSEAKDFVSFSEPTFTLEAGQLATQHITVNLPASAAYSYSFATVINQVNPKKPATGTTAIQGSVAVFTLLSVDRPGATKKLEIDNLSVSKRVYEYLPSEIKLKLKNTGNSLVQPKGTLYVQRHSTDGTPLASLTLNQAGGYILPGTSRTLSTSWSDGYPHYETAANGKQKLSWDGSNISKFRFGRYVAKVIAVYDDNGRDVPLTAEVTFWVIPWRALLITLLVILFIVVGIVATLRQSGLLLRRTNKTTKSKPKKHDP